MTDLLALYEQQARRVRAVAYRIVGDRMDAEDVVQDTFAEAWRRSAEFDASRGKESSWLVAIARSRSLDRVRARRTIENAIRQAALDAPLSRPPDEVFSFARERGRLATALALLPETQRQAIVLAYFEGRTQQEIALVTETPLGTVKTRLRLALRKLHALLDRERRTAALA